MSWELINRIIQPLDKSLSTRKLVNWQPMVHSMVRRSRSMVHSQASSLPLWKIALLLPKLPLPKYLGLIDILLGLFITSCLLPFVLQVVLKRTWAWYWEEDKNLWEPEVLRHLRTLTDQPLLSAGPAFLEGEHILVHRFPRQAHSCQHDPWTSCSGIWTCYWKGVKSRTHTLVLVGGGP